MLKKKHFHEVVCVCRYFDYEPRKNANVKRKKGCAMPRKNLCKELSLSHAHTNAVYQQREEEREKAKIEERLAEERSAQMAKCNKC